MSYDKFYIIATIRYPTDLTTAFDGYTIELSSSNGGLNGVTSSKTVDGKVIFDNLDLQYDLNVHTSTVITATCIDCGFMSNNTS